MANWNIKVKGHDILLKAFEKLNCPNCFLVLVGLDTDGREAKELISRLGLTHRVIPLGFRKDIPDLLNASDYFVLSSRLEGIAGALLQAMATEMVVISTALSGITEYLKNKENGFLVPPENVEALKNAMERVLYLSEKEYQKIAKKARQTAQKYSISRTTEKYIQLFQEILT